MEIIFNLQKVQEQWTYIFYVLTGKLVPWEISGWWCLWLWTSRKKEKASVQILDVHLTEFQNFQLQLGFSFGGFGLHSPAHVCRAVNLASAIEYLRYNIGKNSGCINSPSEWIRSTVNSMEPCDKYSADIIADAYQNCQNGASYFWIHRQCEWSSHGGK
jgi:hypothetical protein